MLLEAEKDGASFSGDSIQPLFPWETPGGSQPFLHRKKETQTTNQNALSGDSKGWNYG